MEELREQYKVQILVDNNDGSLLGHNYGKWVDVSWVFRFIKSSRDYKELVNNFVTSKEACDIIDKANEYRREGKTWVQFHKARIKRRVVSPYETVEEIDL